MRALPVFAAMTAAAACSTSSTSEPARSQRMPIPTFQGALPLAEIAAEMRAEGPAALDRLLAAYDASDGAERERLGAFVDLVAAQRYATVSRLFWYTDLDAAEAAARASGKPILSLRMLGRLDEDRSCANSRFFRVVLYGNAALSRWLRDTFVLHWSSERPVPKLTIDYGDGRTVETTIAGNSAHYVLDTDGTVLDVIPGLVTPLAFRDELEGSLALFTRIAEASAEGARERILDWHHGDAKQAIGEAWRGFATAGVPDLSWGVSIQQAQERAMAKARVEMPVVKTAAMGDGPSSLAIDSMAWEQIGTRLLARRGLEREEPTDELVLDRASIDTRVQQPPRILDAQSRALIAALAPADWGKPGEQLDDAHRELLIRTFERTVVADTAVNLLRLRQLIHAELATRAANGLSLSLDDVNAWVYETLFLTPAHDRWLGMAPGTFTGLPGDGVTIR